MAIFQEAFRVTLAQALGTIAAQDQVRAQLKPNPVVLTPGVIGATEWAGLIVKRGSDAAAHWKAKTLTPEKDPIAEGIKADPYWQSQTKAAMAAGSRVAGLKKTSLAEWGKIVEDTPETAYADGLTRKKGKIETKIGALQPLVDALKKAIAAMPETTDSERENKMRAARRGMKLIKLAMKGLIGPGDITKAVTELGR
jgi:hypothetical protein